MQGRIINSTASAKIQGIIEEYKVASGGNISAGDFVEYLNTWESSIDTNLSNMIDTGYKISAVKLSENKVFIAHNWTNNSSRYRYLYGIVITINGDSITAGTDTQLAYSSSNAYMDIVAVLLNENKIFIAFSGTDTYLTRYYLYYK